MTTSNTEAGIRVRVIPKFPGRVDVGTGLGVVKANGVYTFSLNFSTLIPSSLIADLTNTFVPAWDQNANSYVRLTALSFGAAVGASFTGTSTTSVLIGTGSKSFTASTGRAWVIGQRLRISDATGANVMSGTVTAYTPATGALVVLVDYILGSGTLAAWNITIGGEVGPTGAPGAGTGDVVGPAAATDGFFAIFNGGTGKLLKNGTGAPGALAFLNTVNLATLVTGDLPFANIAQVATDRLLGRDTAGTGDLEALTVTGGLEFTGAGGIQRSALTGNVTAPAGSNTTTIAPAVITYAMLAAASLASQGDAETGTATDKFMSPQRVKQSVVFNAPGGGTTLLTSGTVTAAATLDLVLTAYTAYRGLLLKLINFLPVTDNTALWMRFSTNGGSTYDAGAANYAWVRIASSSAGDTQIILCAAVGNAATEGVRFASLELFSQADAANATLVSGSLALMSPTTVLSSEFVSGQRLVAQDTDALRVMFSSGNIASGKYALYGFI